MYEKCFVLSCLFLLGSCDVMQDTTQEVLGVFKKDDTGDVVNDPGAPLPAPEGLLEAELPPVEEAEPLGPDVLTPAGANTIAGLGDPGLPGLWLETALVGRQQPGRVVVTATGAELNVTLLPKEGDAGSGSSLSLQAMRVLGTPLTELVELRVFPAP